MAGSPFGSALAHSVSNMQNVMAPHLKLANCLPLKTKVRPDIEGVTRCYQLGVQVTQQLLITCLDR